MPFNDHDIFGDEPSHDQPIIIAARQSDLEWARLQGEFMNVRTHRNAMRNNRSIRNRLATVTALRLEKKPRCRKALITASNILAHPLGDSLGCCVDAPQQPLRLS